MMQYPIPQYVLDAYNKCSQSKKFPAAKFREASDESILAWFDTVSKDLGVEITPSYIYSVCISKGLVVYTPARCPVCKKLLDLKMAKLGVKYCSSACASSDKAVRDKFKATMQARYGVTAAAQNKEIKSKMVATLKKNYGVDSPFKSEAIREKAKETLSNKYGVDCSFKSAAVREKIKQTNLAKYGVESNLQSEETKEKIKNTVREKYGVDYIGQSKEAQNKKKATLLSHYGVEYPIQSKEISNKIKQTCLDKYGVDHPMKSKEVVYKAEQTCLDKYGAKRPAQNDQIKEKIKNTLISKRIYPAQDTSQIQIIKEEFLCFIRTFYFGKIIENDKSVIAPKELGIYLPDKKLAFEFDGLYWHSFKPVKYHQDKSVACNRKGIRLIHIFEHEWIYNRSKIENLIKSALGIFAKRIYARNCTVKEISNKDYKEFLNSYHLQNAVNSSIRYGLFYKDELVSVIGFGKSRFKKDEIELHRYCVKSGYQIIGGFSKLIKHANIETFVSFIDFAHYTGKGYKKLGFELVKLTSPSYVYIKDTEIKNRIQCQKHKLSAFLEKFDASLTEEENMALNNWRKVYDCGNLKVVYNYKKDHSVYL